MTVKPQSGKDLEFDHMLWVTKRYSVWEGQCGPSLQINLHSWLYTVDLCKEQKMRNCGAHQ